MSLPPIPVACKDIIRCGCKTGSSSGRCSCRAGKLKCTGACACANSGNVCMNNPVNNIFAFSTQNYPRINCQNAFPQKCFSHPHLQKVRLVYSVLVGRDMSEKTDSLRHVNNGNSVKEEMELCIGTESTINCPSIGGNVSEVSSHFRTILA
ncbi:hypothetical protein GQR58_028545 [Nymphon striatum]|nr:hypothetical protein GQR58_028545 [Nymphon striatum]